MIIDRWISMSTHPFQWTINNNATKKNCLVINENWLCIDCCASASLFSIKYLNTHICSFILVLIGWMCVSYKKKSRRWIQQFYLYKAHAECVYSLYSPKKKKIWTLFFLVKPIMFLTIGQNGKMQFLSIWQILFSCSIEMLRWAIKLLIFHVYEFRIQSILLSNKPKFRWKIKKKKRLWNGFYPFFLVFLLGQHIDVDRLNLSMISSDWRQWR